MHLPMHACWLSRRCGWLPSDAIGRYAQSDVDDKDPAAELMAALRGKYAL
jgi:hypothetical protein